MSPLKNKHELKIIGKQIQISLLIVVSNACATILLTN